jgi:hypothetical protein
MGAGEAQRACAELRGNVVELEVGLHSLPGVRLLLHGTYWLSSIEPCFDSQ